MDRSTTVKAVAGPVATTIELNSDSNTWCKDWKDVSKRFYVIARDAENKPISGITITIENDDPALEITPINTPPTDENGVAILLYTVTGPKGTYQIRAVQVSTPPTMSNAASPVAAELTIEIVDASLPAPRIPDALDGVIDDNDYNGSVVASIISPDMKKGDQVFLIWGDNEIKQTATESAQYYPFILTGPDVIPNELLFQNQTYTVRGFVSEPSGNGHFSTPTYVKVARTNGGGNLKLCDPLDIPMGDDGFINRAEVQYGVSIVIKDSGITNTGKDPSDDIANQLSDPATTAVSINLIARNKEGQTINTLNIPVEIPVNVVDGNYIYHEDKDLNQPKPLRDFLMSIGEGSIKATYNVTNKGVTYTVREERVYEVDVIPPGGF